MARATVKRLLEDATATNSAEGFEINETFLVEEISGNAAARFRIAMFAPGVPPLGSGHPDQGHLTCITQSLRFLTPQQAKVTCVFRIPQASQGQSPPGGSGSVVDLGTISVGASANSRQTFTDRNGNRMIVAHDVEEDDGLGGVTLVREEQTRQATVIDPQTVLRVSRIEQGSPDQLSREFVGTVNSSPLGNDSVRTWLCTRIDGVSNDGGTTYNVSYEFQYSRSEWRFIADFIDKETGLPVPVSDWNTNEETLPFEVYPENDFRRLNIRFT